MSDYHAIASPSKAEMWLHCANSLAVNEGQPEGDKSAADLGTDKHELLSLCLEFNKNAIDYEGHTLKLGHKVNKELAAPVQIVLDNVRELIEQHESVGDRVVIEIEQDVPIDHITDEAGATGRADIVLVVTEPTGFCFIYVIDAKFGWQEVDVEDNPQLKLYAAGAIEKFGITDDISHVNLVIEQPERGRREWDLGAEDTVRWAQEVARPAAQKALMIHKLRDERALKMEDFAPSESTCMWCKGKAVCPALRAQVEETVGASFEAIDESPDAALIAVDDLAPVFEKLELIEDWIKAVRARIELEMFAGKSLPGLKVVAGKKGNRDWVSADEAEAMMKKFRLKVEQMYSFKLLGPKPILELLKDQPRRMKQIETLVVQPQGKPHVALLSDKRPAIDIKPLDDGFEAVEDNSDLY